MLAIKFECPVFKILCDDFSGRMVVECRSVEISEIHCLDWTENSHQVVHYQILKKLETVDSFTENGILIHQYEDSPEVSASYEIIFSTLNKDTSATLYPTIYPKENEYHPKLTAFIERIADTVPSGDIHYLETDKLLIFTCFFQPEEAPKLLIFNRKSSHLTVEVVSKLGFVVWRNRLFAVENNKLLHLQIQ